jgi:hypothetical protein
MYHDDIAWQQADPNDLWVYDKLILSRKLNYTCGPVGMNVPRSGKYIVRPCVNIMGMGHDAEFVWIEDETDHLTKGHFWCEIFEGRHLSVDYVDGEQVDCYEGVRDLDDPLYKWKAWQRTNDVVPYPPLLPLFKYLNVEFIGGKLIEVHLRLSPDARHGSDLLIPVWKGEDNTPPDGMIYVEDPDYLRTGFFIQGR